MFVLQKGGGWGFFSSCHFCQQVLEFGISFKGFAKVILPRHSMICDSLGQEGMEQLIILQILPVLCGLSYILEAGPATVRPVPHCPPVHQSCSVPHCREQGHLFLQDLEKPFQHKESEGQQFGAKKEIVMYQRFLVAEYFSELRRKSVFPDLKGSETHNSQENFFENWTNP